MYSNKENINILTSLLVAHGVRRAVVCPGSRNAPIVHNLVKSGAISCYPVTDQRSAGFYALRMAFLARQAGAVSATSGSALPDGDAVAVCVTSGSALLNLLPAVAEAYYQHVPLIVISADRPLAWIDQQDGQTIRQQNALADFVKKAVTLNEPTDETQRWHCNRLANEALLATNHHGVGPVHINVPLSEPLFKYDVTTLPSERTISRCTPSNLAATALNDLMAGFCKPKTSKGVRGQSRSGFGSVEPSRWTAKCRRIVSHLRRNSTLHARFRIVYGRTSHREKPQIAIAADAQRTPMAC